MPVTNSVTGIPIPAFAGEPAAGSGASTPSGVYPRVCGGTSFSAVSDRLFSGLSPRLRGNRRQTLLPYGKRRSIPAFAGESPEPTLQTVIDRVYPRVCGGIACGFYIGLAAIGLSPRLRGNHLDVPAVGVHARSIPAFAGESSSDGLRCPVRQVYPRVCGGIPCRIDTLYFTSFHCC